MRLYDPDTERLAELPPGPLHLHVEGPDLRAYLTADLLRRVAGRHRRVRVTSSGPPPPGRPLADYNILGVDIVAEAPTPHVRIGGPHRPNGLHLRPAPGLDPPPQDVDPVTLRLAVLSVPYRDPLDLPTGLPAAQRLLDQWRSLLTEWSR
ncbi:MAG TPA: hypothetical protein VHJ17_00165, partial [Thermomonospora sp.]|nr:hypothetical protein [Thermomonospora sp.]